MFSNKTEFLFKMEPNRTERKLLQYVPFKSFVNPGFWHKLNQIKLDEDRLEEVRHQIFGTFCFRKETDCCLFEVDGTSFNSTPQTLAFEQVSAGTLMNKNTIEDFKSFNKEELLNNEGHLLWDDIQSGRWLDNPDLLLRFLILSFADLKKYIYYYWFAFPAPSQPTVFLAKASIHIQELLDSKQIDLIKRSYNELDTRQKSFFLVEIYEDNILVNRLATMSSKENDWKNVEEFKKIYFGFLDPSNGDNPGWPLRNFIAALILHCDWLRDIEVNFIGLRTMRNGDICHSKIYTVYIPSDAVCSTNKGWIGWERNSAGKLCPMLANQARHMDPVQLADASADLNLKLMKWRLLPELDLDRIQKTKCLLLGAGTLGCAVARNLLAWGVRHITFVDSGRVSYSNPVRQTLYTHADCVTDGGELKAQAAAKNLKAVLPSMNSTGIYMQIPMPGHPVGASLRKQTAEDIQTLTDAVVGHNVVFLLLDSREARWLPTLIAASQGKLVINAALGFDSYLVMRHGISKESISTVLEDVTRIQLSGEELGCYFCNDVTAPGNSQKDRTLDQQCTVSRPGVSSIAAALAVEIAVSVIQHKMGLNAPALYNIGRSSDMGQMDDPDSILGPIPHSIRGFLSSYSHVLPSCAKFRQCIACSERVVQKYREDGVDFVLEVCDSGAGYLEELTGLKELHMAAEMTEMLALSDSDEDSNQE